MGSPTNRPILSRDSQDNVVQNSALESAFQAEYSGANLIYAGSARPGVPTSVAKWQIKKLTYSGSNVISVTWPANASGVASSNFEFVWDDRATYTYV